MFFLSKENRSLPGLGVCLIGRYGETFHLYGEYSRSGYSRRKNLNLRLSSLTSRIYLSEIAVTLLRDLSSFQNLKFQL